MGTIAATAAVKEVISQLGENEIITIQDLYARAQKLGVDKPLVNFTADVQSMASRRIISRGPEKQTYCRIDTLAVAEAGTEPKPKLVSRRVKGGTTTRKSGRHYPESQILAELTEALGAEVPRSMYDKAYVLI